MGLDARVMVRGIRPPDDEWKKMKAAWQACHDAKLDPPEEVLKYFNYEIPGDEGMDVEVDTEEVDSEDDGVAIDLNSSGSYLLVDLAKLPKAITHIKVWMSVSY